MLTNTYVGFREVDRDVVEAARAWAWRAGRWSRRVEFPLAVPLIMTGVRTAAVQVVATATLAALVGGGGLGRIINLGFGQQDYGADHRRRAARRRPRAAHRGAARRPVRRAHPRPAAAARCPGRGAGSGGPQPLGSLRSDPSEVTGGQRIAAPPCRAPPIGVAWSAAGDPPARHACAAEPAARDTEGGRTCARAPGSSLPWPRRCCCSASRPAVSPAPPAPAATPPRAAARRRAAAARLRARWPATSSSSSRTTSSCRTPTTSSRRSTPRRPTTALLANLNAVSAALTTDDLVAMNAAVDVERQERRRTSPQGWVDENIEDGDLQGAAARIVVGAANFTESTGAGQRLRRRAERRRLRRLGPGGRQPRAVPPGAGGAARSRSSPSTCRRSPSSSTATRPSRSPPATSTRRSRRSTRWPSRPGWPSASRPRPPTRTRSPSPGVRRRARRHDAVRAGRAPAADGSLILGGPAECPERPFCQPGLEETYGLKFASFQELDAGGPLTKAALQQGEVSIGLVFSSDGALAAG